MNPQKESNPPPSNPSPASLLYERWHAVLEGLAPVPGVQQALLATAIGLLAEATDEELIGTEPGQPESWIVNHPQEWRDMQARAKLRSELSGHLSAISGHEE